MPVQVTYVKLAFGNRKPGGRRVLAIRMSIQKLLACMKAVAGRLSCHRDFGEDGGISWDTAVGSGRSRRNYLAADGIENCYPRTGGHGGQVGPPTAVRGAERMQRRVRVGGVLTVEEPCGRG